jgi:T4 RnlA family RNA ligase
MQTDYGRELYHDLMKLVTEEDSAFYTVDHLMNGITFRVFTYRLASYTDFLKPSALECRGHMFALKDGKYDYLAALPPSKFFNKDENPFTMDLDWSKTDMIMDKMDGSIMTTYRLPIANMVMLKSKTALTSEQAVAANEWLKATEHSALHNFLMYMMHAGYSVSLEWTSPQHRIVLPYQVSNLTVLCARDLNNGQYVPYDVLVKDMEEFGCIDHLVKDHFQDIKSEDLNSFIDNIPNMTGIEGFVIRVNGQHVKIKCGWYVALHHTKDSVGSDKRLFAVVVQEAHDDLRGMFPDDAYLMGRIDDMEAKVKGLYAEIDHHAVKFHAENKHLDRKSFAIKGQAEISRMYFALAMNLYLGKDTNYADWLLKHWKDFGIMDDTETSTIPSED